MKPAKNMTPTHRQEMLHVIYYKNKLKLNICDQLWQKGNKVLDWSFWYQQKCNQRALTWHKFQNCA